MDGDPAGDLKKTVEDLKQYDKKGIEDCCRIATYYSKQLFEIYLNKEDPYFPWSTSEWEDFACKLMLRNVNYAGYQFGCNTSIFLDLLITVGADVYLLEISTLW